MRGENMSEIIMGKEKPVSETDGELEQAIKMVRNELLKHGDLYKGFLASIESPFREAGVRNLDISLVSERILKRIIGEEG